MMTNAFQDYILRKVIHFIFADARVLILLILMKYKDQAWIYVTSLICYNSDIAPDIAECHFL